MAQQARQTRRRMVGYAVAALLIGVAILAICRPAKVAVRPTSTPNVSNHTDSTTPAVAPPRADPVYANTVGMKFIRIEPGEFLMGTPPDEAGRMDTEGPQHKVRITKAFYLQSTELTQKQWQSVMGNNPSAHKGDDLPVELVSWNDAMDFCNKLSAQEGRTYRLPTEAEWEYACRAGTTGPIPGGAKLDEVAWYSSNSANNTYAAGTKKANPWGLYNMLGNVGEWCADNYESYTSGDAVDPTGPASGATRVVRGGAWDSRARNVRAGYRGIGLAPHYRIGNTGFRPALDSQ